MRQSRFATSPAARAHQDPSAALVLVFALLACGDAHAQSNYIGRVVTANGTVTIERPGRAPALAGDGAEVSPGDVIETVGDSGARIRYRDNSELRLRPGTRMVVADFRLDPANPAAERFATQLIKGGLRAITGLIGKRSPANVEYRTATATVGIRGTDFVMRLCAQNECVAERGAVAQLAAPPAARVIQQRGSVVAVAAGGERRTLTEGAAIYQGDVLRAGPDADATLVFRDDARIAVKAGSILGVERYAFDAARPRNDSSVLRLFYGAFRVATGALGRRNPGGFQIRTATATVGIRGTVFDVVCRASCGESVKTGRDAGNLADAAGAPSLPAGMRERLIEAVGAQFAAGADRALIGAIARIVVGGLVSDIYVASGLAQAGGEAPDNARVALAASGESALAQASALALERLAGQGRVAPAALPTLKEALDAALTGPEFRQRLADEIGRAMTAPSPSWTVAATEAASMVSGAVAAAAAGSTALQESAGSCGAAQCDPWRATPSMQAWALLGITASRASGDPLARASSEGQSAGQALAATPGPAGGGLIVRTEVGTTTIDSGGRVTEVRTGQTALVGGRGDAPQFIDKPPGMPGDDGQRPETLKPDIDQTFGTAAAGERGAPGLYTFVNEGSIGVREGGSELILASGEGSFTGAAGGPPRRLLPPAFLATDRFLAGSAVSGQVCQAR